MKTDFRNKRRGKSSSNILLLHDNATPHVAKRTRETLQSLHITAIEYPPYSPDLSPCDFFLFGRLKRELRGRNFEQRQDLEAEVRHVCHRVIRRDEYAEAMQNLVKRWQKCIAVGGEYVEKMKVENDDE